MKRITTIKEKQYEADDRIFAFVFSQRASSNIDLFGVNFKTSEFFVQFKNGTSYIFSEVPKEILSESLTVDSIGTFFNANISKKFTSVKFEFRLVTPIVEPENIENNG